MEHRHFALHKPFGVICQFMYNGKRKKRLLGEFFNFPEGTMAIGRLDENSEGLILLTTDGMTSYDVRDKSIEKEYYVQIDGIISDQALETLQNGVEIGVKGEKYQTLPCKVFRVENMDIIPPNPRKERDPKHGPMMWLSVTVTEGKFRQVRKMCAAVGCPVIRLVRVRVGSIKLDSLEAGKVIELENPLVYK